MRRTLRESSWLLLLALCGAPAHAQPFIFYRGTVNAASFSPPGLPSGSIARGSIFSVFGRNLGPSAGARVTTFPLSTTLQGVSLQVCQDAACVPAIPLFANAGQINAIMPSNAPLGAVTLRATFDGQEGNPASANVVGSSPGLFAVNSGGFGPGIVQNFVAQTSQPINSLAKAAQPGQVVTLWGTGLGPGLNADNVAPKAGDLPVDVRIFVGGKPVTKKLYSGRSPCCAGVDQLVFQVPADTPSGCYVPVQIRTAGAAVSNAVTIAVAKSGAACPELAAATMQRLTNGGNIGRLVLVRNARQHFENGARLDRTVDFAQAAFSHEFGGAWAYHDAHSPIPVGTCSSYSSVAAPRATARSLRALDAGETLSVAAGGVTAAIARDTLAPGTYSSVLGLQAPLLNLPLFLNPGAPVQVQGAGSGAVGAFTASVNGTAPVEWFNRSQIRLIDRSADLTLTWKDSDPPSDRMWIGGGVIDAATNSASSFFCAADPRAGAFTVPSYVMASIPPSAIRESQSNGWLAISGLAKVREVSLNVPGIDAVTLVSVAMVSNTVRFR